VAPYRHDFFSQPAPTARTPAGTSRSGPPRWRRSDVSVDVIDARYALAPWKADPRPSSPGHPLVPRSWPTPKRRGPMPTGRSSPGG